MTTNAFTDEAHPIIWPESSKAAAAFTFDVDAESCTHRARSLQAPGAYVPHEATSPTARGSLFRDF